MEGRPEHIPPRFVPAVLIGLGSLGYLGIAAAIIADVLGSMMARRYNPLSQTISLLARLPGDVVQEIGLYVLGVGALACGAGLALIMWTGVKRRTVAVLILLCGVDIFVLTAFDVVVGNFPYANDIHRLTTAILFLMIIAAAYLFAYTMHRVSRLYMHWSLGAAIALTLLSPVYYLIPGGWKGLIERLLALSGLALLALFSTILVRRDWRVRRDAPRAG